MKSRGRFSTTLDLRAKKTRRGPSLPPALRAPSTVRHRSQDQSHQRSQSSTRPSSRTNLVRAARSPKLVAARPKPPPRPHPTAQLLTYRPTPPGLVRVACRTRPSVLSALPPPSPKQARPITSGLLCFTSRIPGRLAARRSATAPVLRLERPCPPPVRPCPPPENTHSSAEVPRLRQHLEDNRAPTSRSTKHFQSCPAHHNFVGIPNHLPETHVVSSAFIPPLVWNGNAPSEPEESGPGPVGPA